MPDDETIVAPPPQPGAAANLSSVPVRAVSLLAGRSKGSYCPSTAWVWQRARLVCTEAATPKDPT